MGQSSSTEQKKYNNFYHICNIIPDIPQSNHKIWECNNDDLEIPKILDRRYDLDLSPSMLNMDLIPSIWIQAYAFNTNDLLAIG